MYKIYRKKTIKPTIKYKRKLSKWKDLSVPG